MADETNPLDVMSSFNLDGPAALAEGQQEAPPAESKGEAPPEPGDRPAWAPEQFYKDGAVQTEALANSWRETRAELTRSQQALAEAKKGVPELPETPDEYWDTMDWTKIEAEAPNAFAVAPADGQDVMDLMSAMHAAGVPREQAQKALEGYYLRSNEHLDPPQTADERIKAAIEGQGTLGQQVWKNTLTWVEDRASRGLLDKDEQAVIAHLAQSAPGLKTLHNLIRAQGGPPSTAGLSQGAVDRVSEKREVEKLLGDPNTLRGDRREEAFQRWRGLNGGAAPGGHDLGSPGIDPFPGA